MNKNTLLVFLVSFFTFSFKLTEAQCCANLTSTKSCTDKKNGTATVTPCTPGNYTYLWDDTNAQTTAVATGLTPGIYHVTISDFNFSCPFTVNVGDSTCVSYSAPNVLTPNGDGINDLFVIRGLEDGTKITVFNSWGGVVYTSNNYTNDWDASNLTEGVYFYVLSRPNTEQQHISSSNDPSRGFIQILKSR